MVTRASFEEFPKRGKIAILLVSIVFSLSIYSFMALEGLSFLNALYFLVVTVSTVGFGDIQPENDFTKVVLIVLIITGITTLALLSQIAIDKIVVMRSVGNYDLPSESLDLENHIIFAKFTDVVVRIALFAIDRLFEVVIIDRDEEAVIHARKKGFRAYLGEIENPQTLDLLALDRASALYLFLDDDNHIIQSSILAENLAPGLLIYANTNEHLSIEYGQIVGITRTYHNERLLGSFINATVRNFTHFVLPNQEHDDSILRVVLTTNTKENRGHLTNAVIIGLLDSNFMDLKIFEKEDNLIDYPENRRVLALFTKHDDLSYFKSGGSSQEIAYNKILIAGWSPEVGHMVEHLDIDHANIEFFTFNESDYEIAKANGFKIVYCTKEGIIDTINRIITDDDLVINGFKQIADSLLLDVMIRRSERNPRILQIVDQEQEVEVFQKIGVNQVISPGILTSRAMFQILLSDLKIKASQIFKGYHVFEQTVIKGDTFHNKSISKIEKLGYTVIVLFKPSNKKMDHYPENQILETNDRLLLFRSHSIYPKSIQFSSVRG
ncbi:MAG: hypothetical protein HeimC2_35440 [Candidatus Heimdallarchaeota archaeon LC_2]|nr:MAG: hypothetical protein HeimC2_35440 [Candidatus Heimdallarchaeota archaeon LC_2]